MFTLEPGPIELITDDQIPRARLSTAANENIVAPVAQQIDAHELAMAGPQSEVTAVAGGDPEGDFNATVPLAAAEIAAQLDSQSEIDPTPMYVAALESLSEADQLAGGFAREGETLAPISVPGEGSDFLDVKQ